MSSVPGILQKARRWCAAQERCQQEARDKLYAWGLHREQVEQVIAQLIAEGFLNEQRFAEHYAVSKFRQKGWGRIKIRAAMQAKQVSAPCIALGLKAIDEEEYRSALARLMDRQLEREKEPDALKKRYRVRQYLLARGFEGELLNPTLKDIDP